MGRIFAIANQKGGVGKTTTSVNLAESLGATRKHVLMVDLDPQANATMGCGMDKHELPQSIYDVLLRGSPAGEVTVPAGECKFHILPADSELTAAEVELLEMESRERRLAQSLEPIRGNYDYILIDCPPALNMLTVNALVAADSVLIPMQCEYYALEGLSALLNTIDSIRRSANPKLHVEGLLRTMYDTRNSLSNDVSAQLQEHFKDRLYRTIIPRNVRLAEAPSYGMPVLQYDPGSRGAVAYLALAGEIIRRESETMRADGGSMAEGWEPKVPPEENR